jgi:hypothetical protein
LEFQSVWSFGLSRSSPFLLSPLSWLLIRLQLLLFPSFVHSDLSIDHLSDLKFLQIQLGLSLSIIIVKLLFFLINEFLLILSLNSELWILTDLARLFNEPDLVLTQDDLAPVDKSIPKLIQILNCSLKVFFIERGRDFEIVEFLNQFEVNSRLIFRVDSLPLLLPLVRLQLLEQVRLIGLLRSCLNRTLLQSFR